MLVSERIWYSLMSIQHSKPMSLLIVWTRSKSRLWSWPRVLKRVITSRLCEKSFLRLENINPHMSWAIDFQILKMWFYALIERKMAWLTSLNFIKCLLRLMQKNYFWEKRSHNLKIQLTSNLLQEQLDIQKEQHFHITMFWTMLTLLEKLFTTISMICFAFLFPCIIVLVLS